MKLIEQITELITRYMSNKPDFMGGEKNISLKGGGKRCTR